MRISLSRKILLVYSLLLTFSLIQGVLLYSVVEQLRSYSTLKELIIEFKFQVNALENLKDKVSFNVNQEHDPSDDPHQKGYQNESFENEYRKTQHILSQLSASKKKQIEKIRPQLEIANTFLTHYRRAYYELHELIHNELLIHAKGSRAFTEIQTRFSVLEPDVAEKLFTLLMENFSFESAIFRDHDSTALPKLKEMKREISSLTRDQRTITTVQKVIDLAENDYLNSLAIIDRNAFLTDSAAHLLDFCDSFTLSLAQDVNNYQTQLKWIMASLITAAILLTLILYWISRQYFITFLGNQKAAIKSIENGNYDYQLPDISKDELGDLSIFMKNMAGSMKRSIEMVLLMNKKINESEKNIRLLLDSTAEAIYGLDVEGKCTFCNRSFLKLMGYDREDELFGKNIHDFIHHTKIDGSDYPWQECVAHYGFLKGKQIHSDNEMFWRRDGSSFFAECWSHPIKKDGEVIGAVVTFIDITRRKEAQQALRNSEEQYRSLIENIDLGITLVDKDHTIIMTNSAQARMFDRDALSFKGKKCFREFEKRGEICSHCPGLAAMETGKAQETFAHGVKDDGSTLAVRIKAFPVFDEEKNRSGFIEVVEDVTEKQRAEQDLAEEKERLAVTLRSIGDGVITTDVKGRVVLVNKVAEKLCGWSQNEAQGRPLHEVFRIVNEVTDAPCGNPVENVLTTGQVVALDNHTALISKDGTKRSIADSVAAIRDRESEIIGAVLVFRDVTEENIREKELLKSQKLESIGILAGGIAHDFNNILSAILGNINLLRHIISPSEHKAQTYLEEAEKASLRAQNLTHQLLTFSQGGEPLRQAASISDIIRDSTEFILRGTNIQYEYDMPDDLWPVDVDPGQISQVVQNLVLNARHAMPQGGTLQISCSNIPPEQKKPVFLQKNMKFVMVSIADSGIGIPTSVIDSIFDPYFTTKKEGSGLGLSVCHSIIDKHHGYISVTSEQGAGTVFTFYLPTSDKPVAEKEADHHEMVYARENLTVLVMDDDEQIRMIAEAMLSHLGCLPLLAVDGEEAVALYRTSMEKGQPIDVVILDLTIPGGMGGKETVAEILKLDAGANVIVSSGYSNDPIMAKHNEYGFKAAIVKPYQLKELAGAISKVTAS